MNDKHFMANRSSQN